MNHLFFFMCNFSMKWELSFSISSNINNTHNDNKNNGQVLIACNVLDTVVGILPMFSHFIFTKPPWGENCLCLFRWELSFIHKLAAKTKPRLNHAAWICNPWGELLSNGATQLRLPYKFIGLIRCILCKRSQWTSQIIALPHDYYNK